MKQYSIESILPKDFVDFLKSTINLNLDKLEDKYQQGLDDLNLIPLDKLKVEIFQYSLDLLESFACTAFEEEREGHFMIEYVNLLNDEHYNTLVWFTQLNCFGQFDDDHGAVFVFKEIAWKEIQENAENYLGGIYDHGDGQGRELNPFNEKEIPFIPNEEEYNQYEFRIKKKKRTRMFYNHKGKLYIHILQNRKSKKFIAVISNEEYEVISIIENGEEIATSGNRLVGYDKVKNSFLYKKNLSYVNCITFAPMNRKDIEKDLEYAEFDLIHYNGHEAHLINAYIDKLKKKGYPLNKGSHYTY